MPKPPKQSLALDLTGTALTLTETARKLVEEAERLPDFEDRIAAIPKAVNALSTALELAARMRGDLSGNLQALVKSKLGVRSIEHAQELIARAHDAEAVTPHELAATSASYLAAYNEAYPDAAQWVERPAPRRNRGPITQA